jgi:hypothetical protein
VSVTARMAPYLLFGFAVAGVLHVLLPSAWVARFLGGRGFAPSVKAALFGVPLPLCSCSVIPVAALCGARGRGAAPRGVPFLMFDAPDGGRQHLVTYGLLGPVFAVGPARRRLCLRGPCAVSRSTAFRPAGTAVADSDDRAGQVASAGAGP